ncbi:hypothetical protein BS47DRAFT_1194926 [Hydnum rufescens UP504]|uniref:Uncharacterized protein n=1 Tax=Hydnum rufescens UP504 TaxID=1448309 RepID=A0A9P6ASG0_9AGAM|nr:hypothetical protein BS47DRAFT_1194926 [Hydnum rufescens UP504]
MRLSGHRHLIPVISFVNSLPFSKILIRGARAIDPMVLMPSNHHILVFPQAISELQRQYTVTCQPLPLTSTPLLRTYPIILWRSSPIVIAATLSTRAANPSPSHLHLTVQCPPLPLPLLTPASRAHLPPISGSYIRDVWTSMLVSHSRVEMNVERRPFRQRGTNTSRILFRCMVVHPETR